MFGKQKIGVDNLKVTKSPLSIQVANHAEETLPLINVGTGVNTEYTDTNPIISVDGTTMFVYRKGDPRNTGGTEDVDIWMSLKQSDGS